MASTILLHEFRRSEELLPGEVDHPEARVAQPTVAFELLDRVAAVVVLTEAIGFGDDLVRAPEEVDPEGVGRSEDSGLEFRRIQTGLVEDDACDRLERRLGSLVGEFHDLPCLSNPGPPGAGIEDLAQLRLGGLLLVQGRVCGHDRVRERQRPRQVDYSSCGCRHRQAVEPGEMPRWQVCRVENYARGPGPVPGLTWRAG